MFLPLSELLCDVFICFSFSLSLSFTFYSKHKSLSRTLSLSLSQNLFSGAMLFHESVMVVVGDERATELVLWWDIAILLSVLTMQCNVYCIHIAFKTKQAEREQQTPKYNVFFVMNKMTGESCRIHLLLLLLLFCCLYFTSLRSFSYVLLFRLCWWCWIASLLLTVRCCYRRL